MKEVGAVLIIVAGCALGMDAGKRLRQRYRFWSELKLAVGILKGELQYGADPLDEIFERMGERTEGELANFFGKTAQSMKVSYGSPLREVLRENADNCLKQSGLTGRELEQFVNVCAMTGQMDRQSQMNTLGAYLYTIEQEEKTALEKVRQKENMYRCLGFMGGLFFAILLY